MKKLLLLMAIASTIASCSPTSNIKTIKDDPDIPVTITQCAEAKRDLLQKDTLNTVLYESFTDEHYEYDYKITKGKVEFQRRIYLQSEGIGWFIAAGFILGFGLMIILIKIFY